MSANDFFTACNDFILNATTSTPVKPITAFESNSNSDVAFTEDDFSDDFSEDFPDDLTSTKTTNIQSNDESGVQYVKLIECVSIKSEEVDRSTLKGYAIDYLAHGNTNSAIDVWNTNHYNDLDKVTTMEDLLIAFAQEHFAVTVNPAEVYEVTVEELKKRLQEYLSSAESVDDVPRVVKEEDIVVLGEDNEETQQLVDNTRKYKLLSVVTGKMYSSFIKFNVFGIQNILKLYGIKDFEIPDNIGDTVVVKTAKYFQSFDVVSFLTNTTHPQKISSPKVKLLNNDMGIIIYDCDDENVKQFLPYTFKSCSSFESWSMTTNHLSNGSERWNLIRLIHRITDPVAKKKLFSLLDVSFQEYWVLDRAISYITDRFPLLLCMMQGEDVIYKLQCVVPYIHIENKQVFLVRFLQRYFGLPKTMSISKIKQANPEKIVVESQTGSLEMDIKSFLLGLTAYKQMNSNIQLIINKINEIQVNT